MKPTKVIKAEKKCTQKETKFFEYHQNNSGGFFKSPAVHVIVEAHTANEADTRAVELGLYFDGSGDCSCCGNRWYRSYRDGSDSPSVYSLSIFTPEGETMLNNFLKPWATKTIPALLVYYLSGDKVIYE